MDDTLKRAQEAVLAADPREMAKALSQIAEAFKTIVPKGAADAAEKAILDRINAEQATK